MDPSAAGAVHEILPARKVIEELRRLAKDADTIYPQLTWTARGSHCLAPAKESIGGDDSRYKRVVFNEITKKAIQDAVFQAR